jgi:ribosomal protein RSM22 (predicted rRNA methylase)
MVMSPVRPDLPAELRGAIDALLHGVSQKDMMRRSAAISTLYRSGGKSNAAINDAADVTAYAVSRLPATYAAVSAALAAVRARMPDFAPQTLLDIGAGLGTASWAAAETWPDLARIQMVDSNPHFLATAQTLLRASTTLALQQAEVMQRDLGDQRANLPSADLVIGSYVLGEIAEETLATVSHRLWNSCTGVLVIVEPGTPKGYERILVSRRVVIGDGGFVAAPCPHSDPCPLSAPDWCHFTQRLSRSRQHRLAKSASLSFEDEKYAYVAAARNAPMVKSAARVISSPRATKSDVTATLCTEGDVKQILVQRRDKLRYREARKWRWGDTVELLP